MYTIDTETYLIAPGKLAPPLVCLQFAHDMDHPSVAVVGVDPVRDWCEYILRSGELIVGQNIPFDWLTIGRQYPDLMTDIFQAYCDGRIADTIVREKLKRIADGSFWRLRNSGWSLGVLGERYGKPKDAKDPWRMRYAELWGIPFSEWPIEAQNYAVGDVIATRQVYLRQASKVGSGKLAEQRKFELLTHPGLADKTTWAVSADEERQARAAWMLHLISANGVRTERAAIERFEAQERELYNKDKHLLQGTGLVRLDATRNLAAARDRMEEVVKAKGGTVRRTEKGNVSLDEQACIESNDEWLLAYQRYGSRKNLLTRIQALYAGCGETPLNPSFDSLMETGRTSCRKGESGGATNGYQVQNMRRVVGERECFVPELGNVFLACDFDMAELVTLSQCCTWAVGGSELANVLNKGVDPHLALAAEMLRRDYGEAAAIYADLNHPERPAIKQARQICKVANFGFPGGMASRTFCTYARGYGIEITEVQAAALQEQWFIRWREMARYFNWIKQKWDWREGKRKDHKVQVTTIRQFISQRFRSNITYTVACNGFFQGLAADMCKAAGFALVMACELGELKGWKVWNFVHDEYILEGPEWDADRAAKVVQRIMVEEAQKWVPDVKINATPAMMRRWSKKAEPVYRNGVLIPWEDRDVA